MKRGFAAQFGEMLKFLSTQQAAGNSNLINIFIDEYVGWLMAINQSKLFVKLFRIV
jgi:hypothetical protein